MSCSRRTPHGIFWCAFEDGEVVVIGDKPENTIKDRRCPRRLYRAAKESDLPCLDRARSLLDVCLTVKPVGEPDAEIGTSGSMSGDGKRGVAEWPDRARPRLYQLGPVGHLCYAGKRTLSRQVITDL